MSAGGPNQRREERKYRRIFVRYGHQKPEHHAVAQQISTRGLFLLTNEFVYVKGTPVLVEIASPDATWVVPGIVRHAVRVHPNLARFTKPGMGIELARIPAACRDYLASL